MSESLGQMIDALGLEVAAIRKKGGGQQVELRGGERVGHAEGSWLYRFVVPEDLRLRDDTPIRVSAGQEDVSGVLVSFRDGVLLVALEKDLGPSIAAARLVACDPGMDYQLRIKDKPVADGGAVLRKGRLVMPEGPGLGLTVDEKLIRRLSRRR